MTRKVYLDVLFAWHGYLSSLVNYPPEGYEFVLYKPFWDRVADRAFTSPLASGHLPPARILNKFFPVRMAKGYLDKFFKRPPEGVDLIFSLAHLTPWKKPWILLIYWPTDLTGFYVRDVKRFEKRIQKYLASRYCKKVITWFEVTRKALELNLDCSPFEQKMEVIPLAAPSQKFTKSYNEDKVRLLFIGTPLTPQGFIAKKLGSTYFLDFDGKGGRELLEAFILLDERYSNLELVVRSIIPPDIRRRFQGHPHIRFIEEIIPKELLEEEFKSSDIFVFPSHQATATIHPEVMSYELPIITKNLWANSEIVQDGVTGFLIQPSSKVPYYWKNFLPSTGSPLHNAYVEGIKVPDPLVVKELVEKTSILIENKELRRKMGKAARREVDEGKHSLKRRNERLKRIFDEALAG